MFRKQTLVAAFLVAAAGLTAFAVARSLSGSRTHGFTIHSKRYQVAPGGERTEISNEVVYVSARGDVREVSQNVTGERAETIKLVGEGAVYRVSKTKLHYVGQWGPPAHRTIQEMQDGRFEAGQLLGYDVGWATTKAGTRYAVAPALYNHALFMQVFDKETGNSFVTEAYAVDEGEPPGQLFHKPDLPVSREAFEQMEAQRAKQSRR